MAVSPDPIQPVTGRVASVNPKGVKLDGEDDWRNFSRYAENLVPPMRGQVVTLTLDRSGFVRAVQPADGADAVQQSQRAHGSTSTTKDRTITRLAVLKAAAEFAASRPQLKSGEVLKIAASWERWITRADGDVLTDAF